MTPPAKPEKGPLAFCMAVLLLAYYAAPAPILFSPSSVAADSLTNMILIRNPAACFILNIMLGMRYGFIWKVPLACGLAFLPAVFIYYDYTTLVYMFSYIVVSYIGAFAGYSMYKQNDGGE
jgi:hypothetical protein